MPQNKYEVLKIAAWITLGLIGFAAIVAILVRG